ncbi:MAG: hypothetical protein Q9174_001970 [Haloplaca sp. 1 TL-2023]
MYPCQAQSSSDKKSIVQSWELDSPNVSFSAAVRRIRSMLTALNNIIDEAPPDPGPRRFGNVSFRKWYELVETRVSTLLRQGLSEQFLAPRGGNEVDALAELQSYLLGSFGSAQRLDYGSGHELSFLAFLGSIWKLGGFNVSSVGDEERGIVLGIIEPYLQLVRRLIKTYTLEPAGSHGVWGLDDHSFLPYVFGSAQYGPAISGMDDTPTEGSLANAPNPAEVTKLGIVSRERAKNLYFSAIGFIYDVKKGPFWEHSPMLYDISGVRAGWAKINKGMIKMYMAEVLSKFPVVQHFYFGSLFSWDEDPNAALPPLSAHTSSQPSREASVAASLNTSLSQTLPSRTERPQRPSETVESPGPSIGTAAPWAKQSTLASPTAAFPLHGQQSNISQTPRIPRDSVSNEARAVSDGRRPADKPPPMKAPWAKRDGAQSCGFAGDSDIYGIGIRIGYYSQAIAVWLANFFVFGQAANLRSINGLFVFALVVGLIWLSRKPADIFAIEAWLLTQLLIATHYIGVIDHSRLSPKYQRFDPVRRIIHEATFLALWLYMAWYYWNGLGHMKETPCGTYVLFFVVKTNLFGWYRLIGKVFTFVCIPVVLNYAVIVLATVVHHWHTRRIRSSNFMHSVIEGLQRKQNFRKPSPSDGLDTAGDAPHRSSCEAQQGPSTSDAPSGEQICPQTDADIALETCLMDQSPATREQKPLSGTGEDGKGQDEHLFSLAVSVPLPLSPSDEAPGWQEQNHKNPGLSCAAPTMGTDDTFSSLLTADTYMDEVLANFKPDKGCGKFDNSRMKISIVYPRTNFPTPSYIVRYCNHIFRRDHRPAIILALMRHLIENRAHSPYNVHEIFNTAVDHPLYHTIAIDSFNVILSFRVLRLPHKNPSTGDFRALLTLAACCFLIISIELTIAWNRIGGLNNIGAVGQLVPAVIGVGGIIRVALYSQVLHGCSNPRCRTPTCLTCQKRTTKRPLRSFTALSARTLATALALEGDVKKYLCPYNVSQDGVASFEAQQPEDQLPMSKGASCKKSKNGVGDHATGNPSEASKRIDTKSFAQVVFDTQAFRAFYNNTSSPSPSFDLPSVALQATDELSDRPQTLSHFSLANVEALVKFSRSRMRVPELAQSSARKPTSDVLRRFVNQSITHVFSNPTNLVQSFRGGITQSSNDVQVPECYSAPFSDIVQSLRYLKKFDEDGREILTSLFAACARLYASLEPVELGVLRESRKQHETPNDPVSTPEKLCTALGELRHRYEIIHIAQIVLAALVACICPCNEDVFETVEFYHDHPTKMASAGRVVQEVLDTFNNPLGHNLLSILLKLLVLRNSIIESYTRQASEPVPHLWDLEGIVNEAIRDAMVTAQAEPFGCLAPDGPQRLPRTIWIHSPPWPKKTTKVPAPDYLSMVIQWLKYLIIRAWDGNAVIDPYGEVRGALDILQIFHKNLSNIEMWFEIPVMTARLDLLEVSLDKVDLPPRPGKPCHILSYPFVFDLPKRVSVFRAINYTQIYNAQQRSRIASRVIAQLSFPDAETGRGEIQHKLGNVLSNYFVIEIRRHQVLTDAMDQCWRREIREMMRPLKVRMGMDEGEEGVDHGGVQQEFFRLVIAEAFHPDYGLFTTIDEQSQMTWFRPCSAEPLWRYELLGLMFSLAIHNGMTLPVNFPVAFYRKVQGSGVTKTSEIEDGWPMLSKGLYSLLTWSEGDVADVFARTYEFTVEAPGHDITIDMQRVTKLDSLSEDVVNGKPTGQTGVHSSSIPPDSTAEMVTNANRNRYVSDYLDWLTDKSIRPQFSAFTKGLFTLVDQRSFLLFRPEDLKSLVEGTQDFSVDELRSITRYEGGYASDHPTILQFWETVHHFSPEQIRNLLEFVTASDRIPVTGVGSLQFLVQKNGEGDERLPTSSTCYGRLLLPEYSSKEVLRQKLELAIENSKGFGAP